MEDVDMEYSSKSVACRLTLNDYEKLISKKPEGMLLSEFLRKILKEFINR